MLVDLSFFLLGGVLFLLFLYGAERLIGRFVNVLLYGDADGPCTSFPRRPEDP
jgi:hypothetical protein